MIAHQLDAGGVILNTIVVDTLNDFPNLINASVGGVVGDSWNGVEIVKKPRDEKSKIKSDIAALEATITPRRTREAILAIDTVWLADVELQIGQLRQQLAEL